jgi:hypothetical protein
MARLRRDDRGVTPVVGKFLAAGIALLYVAGMTGLLLGSVVPEYEETAGAELADRTLAAAAGDIEDAPPDVGGTATARLQTELPVTIEDASYRLVLSGRTLTLEHPADGIGGQTRLSLPGDLTVSDGTWHSGGQLVVQVSGPSDGRTLTIGEAP